MVAVFCYLLALATAAFQTKQSSLLSCLPLYDLNAYRHFFKWVRKLTELICGSKAQHYLMFTETAVSMQWLEVEHCVMRGRGDTDAYIYFCWQWTQDNDLGKKIEQRK